MAGQNLLIANKQPFILFQIPMLSDMFDDGNELLQR